MEEMQRRGGMRWRLPLGGGPWTETLRPHSYLSATIGSLRSARHAGTSMDVKAAKNSRDAVPHRIVGSAGLTPNKKPLLSSRKAAPTVTLSPAVSAAAPRDRLPPDAPLEFAGFGIDEAVQGEGGRAESFEGFD